jgi:hypothetical protein
MTASIVARVRRLLPRYLDQTNRSLVDARIFLLIYLCLSVRGSSAPGDQRAEIVAVRRPPALAVGRHCMMR